MNEAFSSTLISHNINTLRFHLTSSLLKFSLWNMKTSNLPRGLYHQGFIPCFLEVFHMMNLSALRLIFPSVTKGNISYSPSWDCIFTHAEVKFQFWLCDYSADFNWANPLTRQQKLKYLRIKLLNRKMVLFRWKYSSVCTNWSDFVTWEDCWSVSG